MICQDSHSRPPQREQGLLQPPPTQARAQPAASHVGEGGWSSHGLRSLPRARHPPGRITLRHGPQRLPDNPMKIFLTHAHRSSWSSPRSLRGFIYHKSSTAAAAVASPPPPKPPTPVVVQDPQPAATSGSGSNISGRLHAIDYAEIRPEVSGAHHRRQVRRRPDGQAGRPALRHRSAPLRRPRSSATRPRCVSAQVEGRAGEDPDQDRAQAADRVPRRRAGASSTRVDQRRPRRRGRRATTPRRVLKQAKLDLEHAYVTAPISGRVSRAEITQGNLVQARHRRAAAHHHRLAGRHLRRLRRRRADLPGHHPRHRARQRARSRRFPCSSSSQGDTGHVYDGFIAELRQPHRSRHRTPSAPAPVRQRRRRARPRHVRERAPRRRGGDSPCSLVPDRAVCLRPEQGSRLRRGHREQGRLSRRSSSARRSTPSAWSKAACKPATASSSTARSSCGPTTSSRRPRAGRQGRRRLAAKTN